MPAEIAIATRECHESRLAEFARRHYVRPAHALNDLAVTVREGGTAKSVYQMGSNYTAGCALLVIAVIDGRAMVAGPHGPAVIDADQLVGGK